MSDTLNVIGKSSRTHRKNCSERLISSMDKSLVAIVIPGTIQQFNLALVLKTAISRYIQLGKDQTTNQSSRSGRNVDSLNVSGKGSGGEDSL